jgi:hypothetical protein
MPPEPDSDGAQPSRDSDWNRRETVTRARERLDHATATIETALDHRQGDADDAALRRALHAVSNARGDLAELAADTRIG